MPFWMPLLIGLGKGLLSGLVKAAAMPIVAAVTPSNPHEGGGGGGCFGREDAHACLSVPGTVLPDPVEAYNACFGDQSVPEGAPAARVPMVALKSGDHVLAEGGGPVPKWTRVVVNVHKSDPTDTHPLLVIFHQRGSLTTTPNHLLLVDGTWKPARRAVPGSVLNDGRGGDLVVKSVQNVQGAIIMPFTRAGRIVAASASGAPVVAATLNDGQRGCLLEEGACEPPLFLLYSYLFPAAFDDLEPLITRIFGTLPAHDSGCSSLQCPIH